MRYKNILRPPTPLRLLYSVCVTACWQYYIKSAYYRFFLFLHVISVKPTNPKLHIYTYILTPLHYQPWIQQHHTSFHNKKTTPHPVMDKTLSWSGWVMRRMPQQYIYVLLWQWVTEPAWKCWSAGLIGDFACRQYKGRQYWWPTGSISIMGQPTWYGHFLHPLVRTLRPEGISSGTTATYMIAVRLQTFSPKISWRLSLAGLRAEFHLIGGGIFDLGIYNGSQSIYLFVWTFVYITNN